MYLFNSAFIQSVSSRWLKCNIACLDSHCPAVNCGETGLRGCPPYQRQVSVFNDGNKRHQIASLGVNEVNELGFSQRKGRELLSSHYFFVFLSPNENMIVLRYLWRVVLCVVTENKTITQSTSEALGERRDDSCVPNPVLPSARFNAAHFSCDALRSTSVVLSPNRALYQPEVTAFFFFCHFFLNCKCKLQTNDKLHTPQRYCLIKMCCRC